MISFVRREAKFLMKLMVNCSAVLPYKKSAPRCAFNPSKITLRNIPSPPRILEHHHSKPAPIALNKVNITANEQPTIIHNSGGFHLLPGSQRPRQCEAARSLPVPAVDDSACSISLNCAKCSRRQTLILLTKSSEYRDSRHMQARRTATNRYKMVVVVVPPFSKS